MSNKIVQAITFIIFLVMATGCATTQKTLTDQRANSIQKVVLIVRQASPDVKVIDHTGTMGQTYTGYQFGAIGGLIEGTILAIQANSRINKSLGGDPKVLQEKCKGTDLNKSIQYNISERLSKKYEVVSINKDMGTDELPPIGNADVKLEVGYVYGIAAYADVSSSPVIIADIKITDIKTNSTIIKKRVSSDSYFRINNKIENYVKNDCEIFKFGINEAGNIISILIASEFGIDKNEFPASNVPEEISYTAASCNRPYKLTQDCSFWTGAARKVQIGDTTVKIAGSENGNIILVMAGSHILNSVKDGLTLGIGDSRTEPTKKCLELVTSSLESQNIKVMKVSKLLSHGAVDGYFLELSEDGYSYLKTLHSTAN